MIKIRLHGLLEDVEIAKAKIKETFDVVACSGNYKDRGESKLVRAYVEAKIIPGRCLDELGMTKDGQSTDQSNDRHSDRPQGVEESQRDASTSSV